MFYIYGDIHNAYTHAVTFFMCARHDGGQRVERNRNMRMKNKKIRMKLLEHELTQYGLSKILGVSETTVYRRLRDELPEEEQDRICKLIENAEHETSRR